MKVAYSKISDLIDRDKRDNGRRLAAYRNMILFHLAAMAFFLALILREALRKSILEWNTTVWIHLAVMAVLAIDVAYFLYGWFQQKANADQEPTWDVVTGVWSTAYFEYKLHEEIARAGRYRYLVTLCVIDIDDFRSFNESFGPKRGDELLRQFATTLQGNIRSVDLLARCGEDSFFLLLPHTDIVRAERVISRLLQHANEELNVQFRAGLTTFRVGENALQLQMRAKAALEHAKRDGNKRIQCLISDGENYTAVEF